MGYFDDPRRLQSDELAFEAELAARSGETDLASKLFADAASLEEAVALSVEDDAPRVRGLLAVSAVSLWARGNRWSEVERAGMNFLASGRSMPTDAVAEIRALVAQAWGLGQESQVVDDVVEDVSLAVESGVGVTHSIHVSKITSGNRNRFDILSKAGALWSAFVKVSVGEPPLMLAAAPGSLKADLNVKDAKEFIDFFHDLRRLVLDPSGDLIERLSDEQRTSLKVFLDSLRQDGVKVDVTVPSIDGGYKLELSPAMTSKLWDLLAEDIKFRLDSADIPQADDLLRVFRVVELIGISTQSLEELLDITHRQVNYYKQAARVLGLLGSHGELTSQGWHLTGLDEQRKLEFAQALFEGARVGNAWLRNQRVTDARQIDPNSAATFLAANCRRRSLSAETIGRRAKTLSSWVRTFKGRL